MPNIPQAELDVLLSAVKEEGADPVELQDIVHRYSKKPDTFGEFVWRTVMVQILIESKVLPCDYLSESFMEALTWGHTGYRDYEFKAVAEEFTDWFQYHGDSDEERSAIWFMMDSGVNPERAEVARTVANIVDAYLDGQFIQDNIEE